jgi:sugar phosphate isomerase/epimerase
MTKNKILASVDKVSEKIIEQLNEWNIGMELDFFSFPENLDEKTLKNSIDFHKKILKNLKNKTTLHGAFYDLNLTARDPLFVDLCRYRIIQSIEIAEELGITDVVFHPNYFHSTRTGYKEYWINLQVNFWTRFLKIIENKNITIYLENTREEDASFINSIIEKIGSSRFLACYDTGHSNCFTNSKLKPAEWVNSYGNNLGYVHLHSNNAKTDEHLYFRNGNIDFSDFFEEIYKLESNPLITIEVKTKEDVIQSYNELKKYFF